MGTAQLSVRLAAALASIAVLSVAACDERPHQATLYRNSGLDAAMRVHWATFDVDDTNRALNINNCNMAARLLNANLNSTAAGAGVNRNPQVGFWCEPGRYAETGRVPDSFAAEYPTGVD